ncbi:sialate O-acetylesterase [Serratia ureilytica]|uniref:sialate O-acetylesterase n=1 Tax=Serratia ureilytica TaxID=300181 RepID=UPI003D0642B8
MTKITESAHWEDSVYQIQRGDKVRGGRDGVANIQPQQLANRTTYLKNELETISNMAMADMGVYDSREAAQAAISNGKEIRKYFPVREVGDYWARRYENIEGIATPTEETLSSGAYIDAQLLRNIIQAINILPSNGIFPGMSENPLEIGSERNEVAFGINFRGQLMAQAGFADLLGVKIQPLPPESEYLFVIDDDSGRVTLGIGKNAFVEILGVRIEVADIDNVLEFVDSLGFIAGGFNRKGESLTSTPQAPIIKTEYYDFAERLHLFLFGQSLSNGVLGTPTLNTPAPNALMYNTGVLSRGKAPTSLVPLKENGVETMASALANSFVSHVENANGMGGRQLILNSGGVNGEMIQNLEKGTPAFNDLVNQIRWCHTYNGQQGREHAPDYIVWVHGERAAADGMSGAEYTTRVKQLRKDLEEALADSRDPSKPLMMVIYQMASHGFYVGSAEHPSVEIPLAHLALSHEDDNIMCIGPNYMFAGSDNVHKTNHGYRQLGLQVDKAIRHHILTGEKFQPLEPINFRRISDRVALGRFNVPKPPMVFDDSVVTQLPDGQNGIEAFDDEGRVPIASTEIIAGTQLKVTASRPFVGEVWIAAGYTPDNRGPITDNRYKEWFAGPTTGVRTTLRDSDTTTTELTGPDGKPYPRQNYCVHFYMRVE